MALILLLMITKTWAKMVKSMARRWLVLSPVEGKKVATSPVLQSTGAVGQERVLGHRLPADIAFSPEEHAAT